MQGLAGRQCNRCGETKPITEYHRNSATRDGRHTSCKVCRASQERKRYVKRKSHIRKQQKEYYDENVHVHLAKGAKRRARKLQATPNYNDEELQEWQNFAMGEMYEMAKIVSEQTNRVIHVDHIVPLQNDLVCGLHCIENLQLLPGEENLSKSNRFEVG